MRAGDFAAIGAMAEMTSFLGEEFRVFNCDCNAAAKARSSHAIFKLGVGMGFRIAGRFFRHVDWDSGRYINKRDWSTLMEKRNKQLQEENLLYILTSDVV